MDVQKITQSGALAVLKAGEAGISRKTMSQRLDPLISGLAKTDPEAAEKLRAKLDRSGKAVQSMESALEAAREQRQAFAAERVRQLREQFGILRWFAASDPKTSARLAARISQDLNAAVRDYTDAGRTTAPDSVTDAGAELDGEAIRAQLRAKLEALKDALEGRPKDKAFAVDAVSVRGMIEGLVESAKFGARRNPALNRDIGVAERSLVQTDRALSSLIKNRVNLSV